MKNNISMGKFAEIIEAGWNNLLFLTINLLRVLLDNMFVCLVITYEKRAKLLENHIKKSLLLYTFTGNRRFIRAFFSKAGLCL